MEITKNKEEAQKPQVSPFVLSHLYKLPDLKYTAASFKEGACA